MLDSISLKQWRMLDDEHKVYAIVMLKRRHFMPLLNLKELQTLLNSEEKDINKLYDKYKEAKLYWKDGERFKLYKHNTTKQ